MKRFEFLKDCVDQKKEFPHLRWGQILWNSAIVEFPEKVEKLRATEFDPFYDNKKSSIFLDKIFPREVPASFDFKITTWIRVTPHDDEESLEIAELIKSGEIKSSGEVFEYFPNSNIEQLVESEKQLTPEENGGDSTIEIANEDGEIIWENAQIDIDTFFEVVQKLRTYYPHVEFGEAVITAAVSHLPEESVKEVEGTYADPMINGNNIVNFVDYFWGVEGLNTYYSKYEKKD